MAQFKHKIYSFWSPIGWSRSIPKFWTSTSAAIVRRHKSNNSLCVLTRLTHKHQAFQMELSRTNNTQQHRSEWIGFWVVFFFSLAGSRSIFTFACRACIYHVPICQHIWRTTQTITSQFVFNIIIVFFFSFWFFHWTLNAKSQRSHLKWIPNNHRGLSHDSLDAK